MGVPRRLARKLGRSRRDEGMETGGEVWSVERNVVITGPGRSGTTLACYLLNKLPDTVAVNESIPPGKFADRLPDTAAVADGIQDFYREQRRAALRRGVVLTKHLGGVVPDNSKGMVDGVRRIVVQKGKIPVNKHLSPDFFFAVKQTGLFTALLPDLVGRFACFAIVRNPLAIKASSLSLEPRAERRAREHREGGGRPRNPNARIRYDPGLDSRMQEKKGEGADAVDMWLLRMHANFERYLGVLPREHVIRYEDICESKGRALSVIVPAASGLDEPLENKNLNPLYAGEREKVLFYGERLLASEGAYWEFYTRESVEEIMTGLG